MNKKLRNAILSNSNIAQVLEEEEIDDINERDNISGDTPLTLAASIGNLKAVKDLLKFPGIQIDCEDLYGNTALLLAIVNGYYKTASKLLEKGANYEKRNKEGQAAIHLAAYARFGRYNEVSDCLNASRLLVQLLSRAGADINAINKYRRTPLEIANDFNNPAAMGVMLAHQVRNGVESKEGEFLYDCYQLLYSTEVEQQQAHEKFKEIMKEAFDREILEIGSQAQAESEPSQLFWEVYGNEDFSYTCTLI